MPVTTLAKVFYWHTSGFLELRSQFGQLSLTKVLTSALEVLIDLRQQGTVLGYSFLKIVLPGNLLEAIAHSWQYTEFCTTAPPYRKWDASPHPTGLWEACTSKEYHGCFWVPRKKILPIVSVRLKKLSIDQGPVLATKGDQRHAKAGLVFSWSLQQRAEKRNSWKPLLHVLWDTKCRAHNRCLVPEDALSEDGD